MKRKKKKKKKVDRHQKVYISCHTNINSVTITLPDNTVQRVKQELSRSSAAPACAQSRSPSGADSTTIKHTAKPSST